MNPNATNTEVKSAKIVLLGDSSVGKTSITIRFVHGSFMNDAEATIGAAFLNKTLYTDSGILKLDIWDTAGQERYRSILPMYYRDSCATIIVMSVADPDPFPAVERWMSDVMKNCNTEKPYIILAANKCDLTEERKISRETLENFANEKDIPFYEVSAKDGININDMFTNLAKYLLDHNIVNKKNENIIDFNAQNKGKGCCGK